MNIIPGGFGKMNGKLKISFLVSVVFLLVFSLYGSAQSNPHPNGPKEKEAPECKKNDKGDCKAVCNYHTKETTGEVNEAGCMAELKKKPRKALCPREKEVPEYIGCDATSGQKCTTAVGGMVHTGYWCNCYYQCYDPATT